ncbi:hypothetical protein OE88DRAFT_1666923 [Heliocybe sulcata]|uniref:Uncharacterized protein n=1 Tax=Heliocybe sulcata TaxID=5364 RepID=A0A5C3MQL5_9AGAM|nr:hypothetical protein OE88DRAFT_1666923 [Heliocybe sulcata]
MGSNGGIISVRFLPIASPCLTTVHGALVSPVHPAPLAVSFIRTPVVSMCSRILAIVAYGLFPASNPSRPFVPLTTCHYRSSIPPLLSSERGTASYIVRRSGVRGTSNL